MYIQYSDSILNCLLDAVVRPYVFENLHYSFKTKNISLDVILKHKTPSSFSGLVTARAEINSTRVLPVIARAWLRHCHFDFLIRGSNTQNSLCRFTRRIVSLIEFSMP